MAINAEIELVKKSGVRIEGGKRAGANGGHGDGGVEKGGAPPPGAGRGKAGLDTGLSPAQKR